MSVLYSPLDFERGLSDVEQLLGKVSSALIAGEPEPLEAASTELRHAMVDFARLAQSSAKSQVQDSATRQRLDKVSLLLIQQRESLARRAVVVDRALTIVLPQSQPSSTYSGGTKAAVYRGGAARIYAAVAT